METAFAIPKGLIEDLILRLIHFRARYFLRRPFTCNTIGPILTGSLPLAWVFVMCPRGDRSAILAGGQTREVGRDGVPRARLHSRTQYPTLFGFCFQCLPTTLPRYMLEEKPQ